MREFFVRYGLHASVVLVCLASSVMLWTTLLVHLNTERVRIIESQRQENDNLAKVFEEHVARTIRAAEVMLREIASEYRRHGKAFDLARYAEDRRVYLDPYAALSIVGAPLTLVESTDALVTGFAEGDAVFGVIDAIL